MKRSKVVLAAASFVLATVSVAATKPMRAFSDAFRQQLADQTHDKACVATETACVSSSLTPCTATASFPSGVAVFHNAGNTITCATPFHKD